MLVLNFTPIYILLYFIQLAFRADDYERKCVTLQSVMMNDYCTKAGRSLEKLPNKLVAGQTARQSVM